MAIRLACPTCKTELVEGTDALRCANCSAVYPLRNGIPVFCRGGEFYEEYAEVHIPYRKNPPSWKATLLQVLPYWSWREWKFFRRHLKRGASVIDLGCGRGKEWFSEGSAFVAGADPCWTAIVECARHYDVAVQADMNQLPFVSNSFDCAITSHVIGHIPSKQKDLALAEIARVLKTGGRSLNIIETDSTHRFVRYGKQDSELYQKNFIDTDGHVGLELPTAVLERFRRHGFEIEEARKMESDIIHLRYYGKYLGKGYPERDPHVRHRIQHWEQVQRNPLLLAGYEVALGFYHDVIEPHTTPLDHAMFLAVSAIKVGS